MRDLKLNSPHVLHLVCKLGYRSERQSRTPRIKDDDGIVVGWLVLHIILILILCINLVESLDRLKSSEITLHGRCFLVELVERQAQIRVGLSSYRRLRWRHASDHLERV